MEQWEEEAKNHFIGALKAEGRGDWAVSRTEVVVDPETNINFDYELQIGNKLIALELFRLVDDKEEIKRSKLWTEITNKVVGELRNRGVQGYTIQTPYAFDVERKDIDKFIAQIAEKLEKAIKQNAQADLVQESGFDAKRIEGFPSVSLFAIGPGGAINPTGDAFRFMERKLPKKNQQLSIANHERIILIINWRPLVDSGNMIQACTQIDFSTFPNIDKVYFDLSSADPPLVQLVYDREVYDAFQDDGIAPTHIDELFLSWLANHLSQRNMRAFQLVQEITEHNHDITWLPALSRTELTSIGEEFLKQGRFDEVHWIVDHLKNDPDPSVENPPNDPDGRHNYHLQVERGEDQRILYSVRGRLCWLLMHIVAHPLVEDYEQVFEIVEEFATGENLYVRLQATVPLMELAKRRLLFVRPGTRFMSDALADRIKGLTLRMLEENREYPVVLEWVAHALLSIRDLDNDTAFKVVEQLLLIDQSDAAPDIAWMAIYFSFFRANQFKNSKPFDPAPMQKLLLERLAKGSGRFRGFAMQHFESFLSNNHLQFDTVIPYLGAVASGKADHKANHHFFVITAAQAANHPRSVARLVETAVQASLKTLDDGERDVWYPNEFTKTLQALENAGPEYNERVTAVRKQMEPYGQRIVLIT